MSSFLSRFCYDGRCFKTYACLGSFTGFLMLSTSNITMQFGAKPLFEDVSVKFESGGHYGLIGANGSGKSTFMKILAGTLEPTRGQVVIPGKQRVAA